MEKFYDRKDACAQISDAVKQIKNGFSTAVWIEGKLGVGKTRFIERICKIENSINYFRFYSDEVIHICNSGDEKSEFEYISAIAFELQRKNPKKFETYIQKYFDSVEHISFIDACSLVIPQIKGFDSISKLIENKYNKLSDRQGKVSDKLIAHQLTDMFSDMIITFLKDIYHWQNVVFCIDDIQWLDQASLKVIESVINKCRQNGILSVSLIVSILDRASMCSDEEKSYIKTYMSLTHMFPNMVAINLDNFDLVTTSEVINDTKRKMLINNLKSIYKYTSGNPLELDITLRFSDGRIAAIIKEQKEKTYSSRDTFSIQGLSEIYCSGKMVAAIINALSILKRRIPKSLLFECVESLYSDVFKEVCVYSEFSNAIDKLLEAEYVVNCVVDGCIHVKNFSLVQNILNYLYETGEYATYGNSIARTLLVAEQKYFYKSNTKDLLAISLLCDINPQSCLDECRKLFNKQEQVEISFYIIAANAFCSDISCKSHSRSRMIINTVIPRLVSSSSLEIAKQLCHNLYGDYVSILNKNEQIAFLTNYIKTQVDLSNIDNGDESAIPLFESVYKYELCDMDAKLKLCLLGMSVYEHVLNHGRIIELYNEAEKIVSVHKSHISKDSLSVYYRNKGLCFAHANLTPDYIKSALYATQISDMELRHLMYGTSINNLGLSYFYSGEIKKAKKAFKLAKKHLEYVCYNVARVDNNIGVCCFMLHEYDSAYKHFSLAISTQTEGIFMKACMQTNLALSLYSLKKEEDAKKILEGIRDEYLKGELRSKDTLIYSAAFINLGYIHFCSGEYFKAADYYHMSLIHKYRFQNREQTLKREKMRDFSINKALSKDVLTDLDVDDKSMSYYSKPYSLVPFAFYVI